MPNEDEQTFRFRGPVLKPLPDGVEGPPGIKGWCRCSHLLSRSIQVGRLPDHVCSRTAEMCCRLWIRRHLEERFHISQYSQMGLTIGTDLAVVVPGPRVAWPGQGETPWPMYTSRGSDEPAPPYLVLILEWWYECELGDKRSRSLHTSPLWNQAKSLLDEWVQREMALGPMNRRWNPKQRPRHSLGDLARMEKRLAIDALYAVGLPTNPRLADHLRGKGDAHDGVLVTLAVLASNLWTGEEAQSFGSPHDDVVISLSGSGAFTRSKTWRGAQCTAWIVRDWWYSLPFTMRTAIDGRHLNPGPVKDDDTRPFVQQVLDGTPEPAALADLLKVLYPQGASPTALQGVARLFKKRVATAKRNSSVDFGSN